MAGQLRTLAAHHIFGDQANEPALELARRLAEMSPVPHAAVFFASGGGEAVDTAAKIVRRYWALVGEPQRTVIVSRSFAYHGTNAYGTSLSGIPAVRDGFGNLDILERERLVERVAELEPVLRVLLAPLLELDAVADVRCTGLAAAVELQPGLLAESPGAPAAAMLAARRHGVLSRVLRGVALQISPPFVVTEGELASIVDAVAAGVREASAGVRG